MVNAVLYALNHTRSLMYFVSCHAGKYVKGPMHVDRSGDTSHHHMFLEPCKFYWSAHFEICSGFNFKVLCYPICNRIMMHASQQSDTETLISKGPHSY